MINSTNINSDLYWNTRFAENWESSQGPTQSRFFSKIAIENLPRWLLEKIRRDSLSFADWGCAQGDGTDVWASYIPAQQIAGIDFSDVAISQARIRYPAIEFLNENWLDESQKSKNKFDVVFSSNTLEHFYEPYDVLNCLCNMANKAVVLALPYKEIDRIDEHFYSFLPENIPLALTNGFKLTWSRIVNCRGMEKTMWWGDQIILVYVCPQWIEQLQLNLEHIEIDQFDRRSEIESLKWLLSEKDKEISQLNQGLLDCKIEIVETNKKVFEERSERLSADRCHLELKSKSVKLEESLDFNQKLLVEREELIKELKHSIIDQANLNQSLMAEVEQQVKELNHLNNDQASLIQSSREYIDDKEVYIEQLRVELNMRNKGISGMIWRNHLRMKRIPHYMNRAKLLVASGGIGALLRATVQKWRRRNNQIPSNYIQPGNNEFSRASLSINPDSLGVGYPAHVQELLHDELIIITGVPFDDVGGGQRAAQLARCALKTGRRVVYIYIYQKYDFSLGCHVDSEVNIPGLKQYFIDNIQPIELFSQVSTNATVVFEFPHPKSLPLLHFSKMRGLRTIFELIDDWETSLGGDWFNLTTYKEFVASCDVVVGTAKILTQRLKDLGRDDAVYSPNAANEYIFDKYKTCPRPLDLPENYERLILYFGSLYGEWFAWDYVRVTAEKNPNIGIILIGDNPGTQSMPKNVHFMGARQIDELPGYLDHTDLAILPFVPGKISDAVSPIKVFEYLFSGKPVVSTRLPEIETYPGVYIADNPNDFSELCKSVVQTEELTQENDRFIFQNSWFKRLDELVCRDRSPYSAKVSAIILIHNNEKIIGRCLESLLLHGKQFLKEVIVVDNNSSDDGANLIERQFPSVRLLRNPENGCSSGRNLGASVATGDVLAFFDSDQWFTSGQFFQEALAILEKNSAIGAVGWGAGWFDRSRSDLGGMIVDYCPQRAMNEFAVSRGYRSDIGYLATCGMFMPNRIFEATKGFDTFFDPTCFEDTDISFQIKQLGFEICYRDLTGIRHQPHQTTKANSQSDAYTQLFVRNAEYFKKKWSDYPKFFLDYSE